MNNHKICFILCTNNETQLSECILYLNRLIVPDGFLVDLLTVTEAKSMTSGYNEAMQGTDAKYKVYLHQDTYLLNPYFLIDMISIFESDPSIGAMGLVGYKTVPSTGTMWYEKRFGCNPLYGASDLYKDKNLSEYRYSLKDGVTDVSVCDGCFIATQTDLPWDEKTFDAWDFYDADQCMNFLTHGYRVVVPNQTYPWYVHDDGMYLSMFNYKKYRERFMEKYQPYLGMNCQEIRSRA